ncbi:MULTISPECIES: hypothetical protein [unclassified Streptomyces]|uniref:hypothetical protein n=1 Tax=unclassified Streptomyces TaxID=2593676 RepID=UPI00380F6E69
MRSALAAAIQSLLQDSRLTKQSDLVKLAAVVLLAKAPACSTVVDISSRDVGGWLGCSVSHVGHTLVPAMNASDAVLCATKRSDSGRTESLRLELLPLREARAAADGQPLAMLSKRELATLLRLCEAVTCPGWEPKDKVATPPGFMAWRQNRGAATDRLAMVLLCLEARTDGRVRMAPGRVPAGYRRADVTMARLMGCAVDVAAAVVDRLMAAGYLALDAVGRPGRDRLRVPAVAAAHARVRRTAPPEFGARSSALTDGPVQESRPCQRCAGTEVLGDELVLAGDGWAQESLEDLLMAAEESASGDQMVHDSVNEQVSSGFEGASVDSASAGLHTSHTPVVSLSAPSAGDLNCFSGSAVLGEGRLRERAGAGEDPKSQDRPGRRKAQQVVGGGPLRGEKPGCSPVERQAAFALVGVVPQDLAEALAPVAHLWAGITRASTAAWLAKALRTEVTRLAGIVGPELAGSVLATRLQRRLNDQGPHAVTQLVGWLLHRGLPQRPDCWSHVCDDGIRMDTGGPCESCACRIGDRQSVRRSVSEAVAEDLPWASSDVRRAEVERRLQSGLRKQAAADDVRRERLAQEQALRHTIVDKQRQQLAEAKAARARMACRTCGLPDSAGECPPCTYQRTTADLVTQAVNHIVALRFDPLDLQATADLIRQVEQDTWTFIDRTPASAQAADHPVLRAYERQQLARQLLDQRRHQALKRLANSEQAETEAQHAHRMAMVRSARHTSRATLEEASERTAAEARQRVAHDLLTELLADLHRAKANLAGPAPKRVPWSERCAEILQDGAS